MPLVYKYNILNTVEHPDCVIVKTGNGRYFELSKPVYEKIKLLVSSSGQIKSDNLSPDIVKNLKNKSIITNSDYNKVTRDIRYHWQLPILTGNRLERCCQILTGTISSAFLLIILSLAICLAFVFNNQLYQIYNEGNIDYALKNIEYIDALKVVFFIFCTGLIHEMGHAVAHQKYTHTSYEIGLCINYIIPSFYADVSDTVMLREKFKKVVIGLSGIYFQLITFPLFIFVFYMCGNIKIPVYISMIFLMQILLNLFPAMRSDGYWIYCDLLGINRFSSSSSKIKNKFSLKQLFLYILAVPTILYLLYFMTNGAMNFITVTNSGKELGNARPIDVIRGVFALVYIGFTVRMFFYFMYSYFRRK